MWPDEPLDYVKLAEDQSGLHFGIFSKGILASVVSLFISNEEAQFRKLATDTAHQRRGYAGHLIRHIFSYCNEKHIKRIWCNARQDKTSFYEGFGMQETKQVFEKGGINYVVMEYISDK